MVKYSVIPELKMEVSGAKLKSPCAEINPEKAVLVNDAQLEPEHGPLVPADVPNRLPLALMVTVSKLFTEPIMTKLMESFGCISTCTVLPVMVAFPVVKRFATVIVGKLSCKGST